MKLYCLVQSIFEGEKPACVILSKKKQTTTKIKKRTIDLYSDIYKPISFTLVMMIETSECYIFDNSLDEHNLHSRSQLYEKSNILCICLYAYLFLYISFVI